MKDLEASSDEAYRPISPSQYLDLDQNQHILPSLCPVAAVTDAYSTPETEHSVLLTDYGNKPPTPPGDDTWSNSQRPAPRLSTHAERELLSDNNVSSSCQARLPKRRQKFPWITGGFMLFPFYHFIKHLSSREVDSEVARLLEQRGCLHVPTKPILEEFVNNYFLYFHPLVPLLDEQRFWASYSEQADSNGYVSLFVLQAMLFVSSPYVSLESLVCLGFHTVKEAQDEFYSRATTLFDLQPTLGDQERAQGAIMLTYRTISFMDKKPLYWLSIATHYAKSADAHRYHEKQDTREGGLLKRLWWCCVLRDRILALALRQSPLLSPTAYNCPELSVADFAHEIGTSRVYDGIVKRLIVQIAIALGDLGTLLSEIPPAPSLAKVRELCRDEIEDLTMRLDKWYDKTYAMFRLPTLITGAHESLILFSNVLCTYYHAAKTSLYNHTLLSRDFLEGEQLDDPPNARIVAHKSLGCCLRSITENMIELKDSGLVQYLPVTFISFAATPFIWYLLQSHIQNTDGDTQRDLDAHLDVMNQFNRLYDNATSTIKYIQGIVEHLKISVPLPTYTASSHGADEHVVRPATLIEESWSSDTWADMLLKDPRMYLRIALAVEFSLARGRCPAEEDFPQWLRDHRRHEDEPYSHSSSTRGNSSLNSVFFSEAMEDFADEDQEVL
ncbi:hypothetical protein NW756_009260 [Fusarium oxysporum]|nr:hypothetical protein NW753_013584 [Fusarium oxysporum]KAJ4041824.1 hypothetical protein NW763_012148 [Fusarium oxysporum]KAJ4084394.1 hypothetical protein NW756_009260 [Fusarium oxysporum]KAJ4108057.1 hypothetical protein NW769_009025 [Fusarium oxysporum]KAJ4226843.1 hypothetical protein NW760_008910 [Fusarium oxysporum]